MLVVQWSLYILQKIKDGFSQLLIKMLSRPCHLEAASYHLPTVVALQNKKRRCLLASGG